MSRFLTALEKNVLLGDGALGTMLSAAGLPPGESPELWMLTHPEILQKIHHDYFQAGARVIQTNTFGANRLKLQEYQASSRVREINLTAAQLARSQVKNEAFVAGIVGPCGYFPAPLSDYSWAELVPVFSEQMEALQAGGVDFIFLETFSDLGEIRAALYAAKNFTTLPVACSLTFTGGKTLTGTTPQTAAIVLEAMGADLLGANCSTGSRELLPIIEGFRKATNLPLLVEPNAGIPSLINGETVYSESPPTMAAYLQDFLRLGVKLIGGCCGTTPEHIHVMGQKLQTLSATEWPEPVSPKCFPTRLASRTQNISLGKNELPRLIGERINPTARKSIAEALRQSKWALITEEALHQIEKGAELLDLNVGLPGGNESNLFQESIRHLQTSFDIPLVLDSTNPLALEKGLQEYQGKALINSVNGEEQSLTAILPLAQKYGAAVLGLTLDEKGIPAKAEERFQIAEKIVDHCLKRGISREDILIDCLALTVATDPAMSRETIKTIRLVKKHLGVTCLLGLSNISHGLPQRTWLNNSFLALALDAGLDAVIANPLDPRILPTLTAGALLGGRDPGAQNYLQKAGQSTASAPFSLSEKTTTTPLDPLSRLQHYIMQGQKEPIIPHLEKLLLQKTIEPLTIIKEGIIPPLTKMGDLFASGDIFLPQLLLGSETAKIAMTYLQKKLPVHDFENKGTIILGTVKGDIHDLGKNIVKTLLENHGYRLIDLGKNVPAETFIQTARREKAQIIGLSALMTTTMIEMEKIIQLVQKEKLAVKILVGGAVVTPEYAAQIGADGYAKDAGEAVHQVIELLTKEQCS